MLIARALLVLACFFFALYAWGRRRDPRMVRNGVFLTMALGTCVLLGLTLLASTGPAGETLVAFILLLIPLTVVALSIALIANGLVMLRREGRSLGNLLSLMMGVLVPGLPLGLLRIAEYHNIPYPWNVCIRALSLLVVLVVVYLSVAFVSFAVYSVVYGRTPRVQCPSAIVILGSGLINGKVPPLLRSRLDRALDIYRNSDCADDRPLLVPSGGQGADEDRAEGQAMAEYLIEHDADPRDVQPETKSSNTWENINFSAEIISQHNRSDQCFVVTNNYHVLRAASLTRKAGVKAIVVGSATAKYFVPSAFIREFVAIISQHRWLNALACSPFIALTAFALWESLQQR
jgi:uncharacterized SAM-binding protein YcdF (DUF218 family)